MTRRALLALLTAACASAAQAQQATEKWPSRPIVVMSGFPAGGLVDTAIRIIQENLQRSLGATVVPVPVAGGGGAVATQKLKNAAPDGYTLLLQTTGTMFSRPLISDVGYAAADFTPIATVNSSVTTIAVRQDAPWKSLQALLADARGNPGKLNYGASGIGGLSHVAMDFLGRKAGVNIVHVPYQGGPHTLQALLGGQVQIVVGDNPHKELRYLAITQPARSAMLPDVPTLKELGFDIDLMVRAMLIGPKGLPEPIVERLEGAVRSAVSDPGVREKFAARGLEPRFEGPKELAQVWQRDARVFKERIEALGLTHYLQPK